mgnify:FL=1
MTKEFEITDGKTTTVVGYKTIEGGILLRGFRLTDEKQEAEIRATEPDLLPSDEDEIEVETKVDAATVTEPKAPTEPETSNVPVKEPAKDVNEIVADTPAPAPTPDFEYALTLNETELDKYASTFGCKLDGRKALDTLRGEFAEFCGITWEKPEQVESNGDLPKDLLCPHCGTKARTEKSYNNNHGDKCFKALDVK